MYIIDYFFLLKMSSANFIITRGNGDWNHWEKKKRRLIVAIISIEFTLLIKE
jgi:hypothetical protein